MFHDHCYLLTRTRNNHENRSVINRKGLYMYITHHKGSLASCALHRTMRFPWGRCNHIISKHPSSVLQLTPSTFRSCPINPPREQKRPQKQFREVLILKWGSVEVHRWENPRPGRQHTQGQSSNAPDHMDFFIPTDEEIRAAYGKVVSSWWPNYISCLQQWTRCKMTWWGNF